MEEKERTTPLDRNLESLGLGEVITALAGRAYTYGGRDICLQLRPAWNVEGARTLLSETEAACSVALKRPDFHLEPCEDIYDILEAASKKSTLSGAKLRSIIPVLRNGVSMNAIFSLFEGADEGYKIVAIRSDIPKIPGLAELIEESIDRDGNVLSTATPAIEKLFNAVSSLKRSIREKAEKYLSDPAMTPLLQDSYVTLRDNRFVLPVKAEEKSHVEGIIHGSSNSGQTYFIEPKALVDINNRLRTAEIELEEQINRFLAELTAMVAEEANTIYGIYKAVCRLDAQMARARFSMEFGMNPPVLGASLDLRNAANPIMLLEKKNVVRNSLAMPEGAKALVISGPNTGGKTVLLKLVGLASAMAAMGLYIPADKGSVIPFYNRIYADIGDNQSISDDLSSFSGHIMAIRDILDEAKPGSLALLDELMINTDPKEGSALAMATLEKLVSKGVDVAVTTHYHDMKAFAQTSPLYSNVSMEFDKSAGMPTYNVIAGAPGESSAISVAEKLKLDPSIITSAKAYMSGADQRVEKTLAQLRDQKASITKALNESHRKLTEAQKLREDALKMYEDAKTKQEESAKNVKKKLAADVRAARSQITDLLEEACKVKDSTEKLMDTSKKLARLEAEVAKAAIPEQRIPTERLKLGDKVYLIPLGQRGTVVSAPSGGRLEIALGKMSMTVSLNDVVGLGMDQPVEKRVSLVNGEGSSLLEEGPLVEINIRGMRVDDGVEAVERQLDKAYGRKSKVVRIIHGKGTGALRSAVREHLSISPYVEDYRSAGPDEGGDGATVVNLK